MTYFGFMKLCVSFLTVVFVSACSHTVMVPPIAVNSPLGLSKISGKYAAQVQTGGWTLNTKIRNGGLPIHSYVVDLNRAYANAMHEGLKASLENVEFVSETLSADQLKAKGFDAQIVVYQGHAEAVYSAQKGFWMVTHLGDVSLTTTLAIVSPEVGLRYQHSLEEKGTGAFEVMMGNKVEEVLEKAAGNAIEKIVQATLLYVRDGLHSIKGAE
jgi:hypothetical protein